MSITRINEFQAREGEGDSLRELIRSFVPLIETSQGCHSCQLLQNQEDPTQIVVIEVWDSIEAHQASADNITPGTMEAATRLLAGPPRGGYYRSATELPHEGGRSEQVLGLDLRRH